MLFLQSVSILTKRECPAPALVVSVKERGKEEEEKKKKRSVEVESAVQVGDVASRFIFLSLQNFKNTRKESSAKVPGTHNFVLFILKPTSRISPRGHAESTGKTR